MKSLVRNYEPMRVQGELNLLSLDFLFRLSLISNQRCRLLYFLCRVIVSLLLSFLHSIYFAMSLHEISGISHQLICVCQITKWCQIKVTGKQIYENCLWVVWHPWPDCRTSVYGRTYPRKYTVQFY